jgi:glycosyltransferase involved in cell wall biosynthesis
VRILYLADIRFPLERANGIQSMETCHALAARGHEVTLVVRPDSHAPARDPFVFYGLPRIPGFRIEIAAMTGAAVSRRAGYLTFAIGRAMGRTRQDLIFTRDLGLASLLLRLPSALRAPLVYEAHGIAADVAAALPGLLTGAAEASPVKLRRLARRDARVWKSADGYVTITAGLAEALRARFGERPRIALVPDGAHALHLRQGSGGPADLPPSPSMRWTSQPSAFANAPADTPASDVQPPTFRLDSGGQADLPSTPFTIGYAGHLYPWKGVDLVIEAVAALPDAQALIIGGHEQEPDLARMKAFARQLDCESRVTFAGLIPPADVAARLREADVLTLPNRASAISSTFTSPLKLFEYMASGRPIVASDLPSLREVLRDGENALLVEPGNPQALVAGIARIQQDETLGRRLAAQAMQDVRQFTWARRAERLETLFADVARASA